MKILFSKMLWSILTGVFAVLLVAAIIGTYVCNNFGSAAINMMFGTSNFKTVNDDDAEPYKGFKTSYEFELNGENLYKEDAAMIEEAEAAGAVLLWNKAKTLPLAGSENVSLLGHSSVDVVECGSGSGYVTTFDYKKNQSAATTMKQSFESRGFTVNPTLWNFYSTGAGNSYKMTAPETKCTEWQQWWVNEVPWNVYTADVKTSFNNFNDVAVVIISRSGGEYSDLHYNYRNSSDTVGANDEGARENTSANGGYLGLTSAEKTLLSNVTSGGFKKVVLLLNTGNQLQMQDIQQHYSGIDACMWIGQPGSTGMNAVADLLKGKDLNNKPLIPSGRLTDTWAYDNNSAPATVNDGSYIYQNNSLINAGHGNANYANKYLVYQEGIYVGYRYYETRYADCVTNEGANAASSVGAKHSSGNWNYNEEVAFPFGYGLSYTTFAYSNYNVTESGDNYNVSVQVTNVGDYAGREVVQAYLQKPYTEYDKENKIEKSAIELVGYAKTKTLEKGGIDTVTIKVPKEYFKTYDANKEETYIIEAGDYYLSVGTDSHTALNNILEYRNFTPVAQSVLGGAGNTKTVNLGKNFVKSITLSKDFKTYSKSAQTGYEITNVLNSGDINKYVNRGDNSVTYLSRKNWSATYPQTNAVLKLNIDMASDLFFDILPTDSGQHDMPKYDTFKSGSRDGQPYVKQGDAVAYMFMDAPLQPEKHKDNQNVYDDGLVYSKHWEAMWDQLLDQMSFEEQALMVANSYHQIQGAASIAFLASKQENGPVGITKRAEAIFSLPNDAKLKGENGTGWIWVAYPCAGIIASSFDNDIAQRVGEHKSEDMLYLGYNGIYGPGVNMHRSPFGGRAFEYPSEDPFLAGMSAGYESKGIQSKGCLAYAKHYALNDMETNRVNCGIWSNEQASREIYFRAFEIVFTDGGASATMNSFTRLGTRWAGGSYAMMTTILRDEWGFEGIVISDWVTSNSAMSALDGVLAGTDTFDGNWTASVFSAYKNNPAVTQAIRQAVKRVIYNVVRTNVMNGTSINSRVVAVTPWWQTALLALEWSIGSIFFVCAGMLTASIVLSARDKKKKSQPASDNTASG